MQDPKRIHKKPEKSRYYIPKRSKRRAKQEREYKTKRDLFIVDKNCARCKNEATEVHHMKGRIERLLNDEKFWLPVCRTCHQYIEQNPKESKSKGWSLDRI